MTLLLLHFRAQGERQNADSDRMCIVSLIYLSLVEATVLNFLAPMGACGAMGIISSGSVSWVQITSGIISLLGIGLITHPEPNSTMEIESMVAGNVFKSAGVGFAILGAQGGMVSCQASGAH